MDVKDLKPGMEVTILPSMIDEYNELFGRKMEFISIANGCLYFATGGWMGRHVIIPLIHAEGLHFALYEDPYLNNRIEEELKKDFEPVLVVNAKGQLKEKGS